MNINFIKEFLTPLSLPQAKFLFEKENPSFETLTELINQLKSINCTENLNVLLTVLKESSIDDTYNKFILKIQTYFLIKNLENNELALMNGIFQQINFLCKEKSQYWLDIFPDLISCFQNSTLNFILIIELFPLEIRELFYKRILASKDYQSLVPELIKFIQAKKKSEIDINHLQNLVLMILESSLVLKDEIFHDLTLLLSSEQLVELVFKLKDIGSTYSIETGDKRHKRFKKQQIAYFEKYNRLVTNLAIRATSSVKEYKNLIRGKPELANLIMIKRLQAQTSPKEQMDLVFELLENFDDFEKQDPLFYTITTQSILHVFNELPAGELQNNFKKYFKLYDKGNPRDIVSFLDSFFQINNDIEKVISCIDSVDDADKTIIINFITMSHAGKNLMEACLDKLEIERLSKLCGHMLALRQIVQTEREPLSATFCRILAKKLKESFQESNFKLLAEQISCLPEPFVYEFIQTLLTYFEENEKLEFEFFIAIFNENIKKEPLFYQAFKLYKKLRLSEKIKLIQPFLSHEFVSFYLYHLQQKSSEEELIAFIELVKETDRQPLVLYWIISTPFISKSLLMQLLVSFDEKNIITLIDQLFEKSLQEKDYDRTLEYILEFFCYRLQLTYDETAAIHQWICLENHKELAAKLLKSPLCFDLLASRSSLIQDYTPNLLQGYLVYSPEIDLKLRANRVLNLLFLNEEDAMEIAFTWLSHYRHEPKKIQSLFVNLESAQKTLNENGIHNYHLLKKTCFKLLKSIDPLSEFECFSFLTTQLEKPHCFDPILTKMVFEISKNGDMDQCAFYLSEIEVNALELVEKPLLIKILSRSTQKNTQENWAKVKGFLQKKDKLEVIGFFSSLIDQIQSQEKNPELINYLLDLMHGLVEIELLLPHLNNASLIWFISEIRDTKTIENFPQWILILLNECGSQDIDYGTLLSILPLNQSFLYNLYQTEALQPYLQKICLYLASNVNGGPHLVALFETLNQQSNQSKRQFLKESQKIKLDTVNPVFVLIINMILLNLDDLTTDNEEDIQLVLDHLERLVQLEALFTMRPQFLNYGLDIQQLVLNTILILEQKQNDWTNFILKSETFSKMAILWMENQDKNHDMNPLIYILLKHPTLSFHPLLQRNSHFQTYIYKLLLNPFPTMKEEQFLQFFNLLDAENQKQLALDLLKKNDLKEVQCISLLAASHVIPIETLYCLSQEKKSSFIFFDLLARHPDFKQLKIKQQNSIVDQINSNEQLLRILESYSSTVTKHDFVDAIFNYLEQKGESILNWFAAININSEGLAAFMNFTSLPKHKKLLINCIFENSDYKSLVSHYLCHPNLDMFLESNGFLMDLVQENFLNPWKEGILPHPTLIQEVRGDILKAGVKAQFEYLSQLSGLEKFFNGFNSSEAICGNILFSARWLCALPLLTDGLIVALSSYQKATLKEKERLKNTRLYKKILHPLIEANESFSIFEIGLTQVLKILKKHYEENPSHASNLLKGIQEYQHAVSVIQYGSDPRLHQLFRPDSYFGTLKKGKIHNLRFPETEHISHAAELHLDWIKSKPISVDQKLLDLTQLLVKKKEILSDKKFCYWIVSNYLLSPLTRHLDSIFLQQILGNFSPKELNVTLQQLYEFFLSSTNHWRKLIKVPNTTIKIFIHSLLEQSETELNSLLQSFIFVQEAFYLKQIIQLCLQLKKLSLSALQIDQFILSSEISLNLEMEWLHNEMQTFFSLEIELKQQLEKMALIGFCYNKEDKDLSRLKYLSRSFLMKDPNLIAAIINSYASLFSDKKNLIKPFLIILKDLFFDSKNNIELLKKLNTETVHWIIKSSLNFPEDQEALLNDFVQAGYQDITKQLLNEHCKIEFQANDSYKENFILDNLNLKEIEKLTFLDCKRLIIKQRLGYQIEPLETLQSFLAGEKIEGIKEFCADASLYESLINLKNRVLNDKNDAPINKAKQNIDCLFETFLETSKGLIYYEEMTQFYLKENQTRPAISYHWLCLSSFLTQDKTKLIASFLSWFDQITIDEILNQPFLDKLLNHLLSEGLLQELCCNLCKIKTMTDKKLSWLFDIIISSKNSQNAVFFEQIVTGFPWHWVEKKIKESKDLGYFLLEAALMNPVHIESIKQDSKNKVDLLSLLNECQFEPNKIIHLILTSTDKSICSLLAFHLLGRKDYILKLEKVSKTNWSDFKLQSPLKSLVFYLNVLDIPPEAIKDLPLESIFTLLGSILNFHQLDDYLPIIFKSSKGSLDKLIFSWIDCFALTPNIEVPLLQFFKLIPKKITLYLKELAPEKKDALLFILIKNMSELPQEVLDILPELLQEDHLNILCHLYLYKPELKKSIPIIHRVVDELLKKNHHLKSDTMNTLITLCNREEFELLNQKLIKNIQEYFRNFATFGNCSIFYELGCLNWKRISQSIFLQDIPSESAVGFLSTVTHAFNQFLSRKQKKASLFPALNTNPLIDRLVKKECKAIKAIDYFLIYYRGESQPLQKFIKDYLTLFSEKQSTHLEELESTAYLLTVDEVPLVSKNALFDVLIKHTDLFNDMICNSLLNYKAKEVIEYFGLRADYNNVIKLCQTGLNASPQLSDRKMIKQALKEAQLELNLSFIHGFLSSFRIWIKRIFYYGWNGWFHPKKPSFVLPFELIPKSIDVHTDESKNIDKKPTGKNFHHYLDYVSDQSTLEELDEFLDSLKHYEYQFNPKNQWSIREKIDTLFSKLYQRGKIDHKAESWLSLHLDTFLYNRKCLIGNYCCLNEHEKLYQLLERARFEPGRWFELSNALIYPPLTWISESDEGEKKIMTSFSLTEEIGKKFSSFSSLFWRIQKNTNKKVLPSISEKTEP